MLSKYVRLELCELIHTTCKSLWYKILQIEVNITHNVYIKSVGDMKCIQCTSACNRWQITRNHISGIQFLGLHGDHQSVLSISRWLEVRSLICLCNSGSFHNLSLTTTILSELRKTLIKDFRRFPQWLPEDVRKVP
jgi:hypothetical protein